MYTCEPVLGYLCGENVLLLMMSPFPAWMLGREHSGKLNIIYSTSITMECDAGCEGMTPSLSGVCFMHLEGNFRQLRVKTDLFSQNDPLFDPSIPLKPSDEY